MVIEAAVGGTVVIGDNAAAIAALQSGKEDKFNKGIASGYASLDGSARVPVAQLENGSATVIVGLSSAKEDKSNNGISSGYASLDGTAQVPSNQLGNVVRNRLATLNNNGRIPLAQLANLPTSYQQTIFIMALFEQPRTTSFAYATIALRPELAKLSLQISGWPWLSSDISLEAAFSIHPSGVLLGQVSNCSRRSGRAGQSDGIRAARAARGIHHPRAQFR
jgi:hypothetical protein